MVDEHGEIIKELEPYTTGSLTAELSLYEGQTPAGRTGLGIEYGSLALVGLILIRRVYRR